MKILTLNYEYPPLGGGAAPVSKELAEQFAARGHDVEVITMQFDQLPKSEICNGVKITRVPAFRAKQETCTTPEMASYVASALPVVANRLKHHAIDVVHCHFAIPTGLLGYIATHRSAIPYVITCHGSDIPGYNPDRFTLEHRMTSPILRAIMRNAASVTAPSKFLIGLAKNVLDEQIYEHIPNGIGLDKFAGHTPNKIKGKILMTGRLLPRKGFQHVLTALQRTTGDFEVHIAGDGPMMEELRRIAEPIPQRVVFHGWLDHGSETLQDLYETSSIFCLPSSQENASISLLEAMASRMAVITSDVTGCPETVADTGFCVDPEDTDSLSQILSQLIGSSTLCERYGESARQRVEAKFDWRAIATSYLKLFKRVANH